MQMNQLRSTFFLGIVLVAQVSWADSPIKLADFSGYQPVQLTFYDHSTTIPEEKMALLQMAQKFAVVQSILTKVTEVGGIQLSGTERMQLNKLEQAGYLLRPEVVIEKTNDGKDRVKIELVFFDPQASHKVHRILLNEQSIEIEPAGPSDRAEDIQKRAELRFLQIYHTLNYFVNNTSVAVADRKPLSDYRARQLRISQSPGVESPSVQPSSP